MAKLPEPIKPTSQTPIKQVVEITDAEAGATHAVQEQLYGRIVAILEDARAHVARSVNAAMVHAYWHIGREIVEVEQGGTQRAAYGEQIIDLLSTRLRARFGQGFGVRSLRRMRQFYLTYPGGSLLPGEAPLTAGLQKRSAVLTKSKGTLFPPSLSWAHYLVLIRVQNDQARAFYEIEATRENWATRELERQVASLLFERLAKSRDKDQVRALAREGQKVELPSDVLKDPLVLEFLDMPERTAWHERDLEQAIIDRLEGFLLELGRGFCFVARQKRISVEGDHFYIDLVFYNRLLRCFVLCDLKLSPKAGSMRHLMQSAVITPYGAEDL